MNVIKNISIALKALFRGNCHRFTVGLSNYVNLKVIDVIISTGTG